MNREIKFRALTKNNNVMVFGDLILCPNSEHRILWFELKGELQLDVDYDSFNEIVKSNTIGQFTGLTDKNGKEIYEGDICKVLYTDWPSNTDENISLESYLDSISEYAKVIWDLNQWKFEFKENKYGLTSLGSVIVGSYGFIKVIGNIHENPELLT